jgi:hypothetical protein
MRSTNSSAKYFIFRGIDGAEKNEIRERLIEQHRAYVRTEGAVKMLHGGPLYGPDDSVVGTSLILQADSFSTVKQWIKDEPFNAAGLFAEASIDQWGWTFGRPVDV